MAEIVCCAFKTKKEGQREMRLPQGERCAKKRESRENRSTTGVLSYTTIMLPSDVITVKGRKGAQIRLQPPVSREAGKEQCKSGGLTFTSSSRRNSTASSASALSARILRPISSKQWKRPMRTSCETVRSKSTTFLPTAHLVGTNSVPLGSVVATKPLPAGHLCFWNSRGQAGQL